MAIKMNIYSLKQYQDEIIKEVEKDGTTYTVTINWVKGISSNDPTMNQFLCILFK